MKRRHLFVLLATMTLVSCTQTTANHSTATEPVSVVTPSATVMTTVPTTAPATTTAPVATSAPTTAPSSASSTAPLVTQAPVSAPSSGSTVPNAGAGYTVWDTPQLGREPVRGSGCGADGSLGNVIPDGWWYGYAHEWSPTSIPFDVICVYYGESAKPIAKQCWAEATDEADKEICGGHEVADFWVQNNNERLRNVPFAPDINITVERPDDCPGMNPREGSPWEALIHIVNGQAVQFTTYCSGG